MNILEISEAARNAEDLPGGIEATLTSREHYEREGFNFRNGCHAAEVEIDPETGVTRLVGHAIVNDFGNVTNPLLAAGQVMGGTAQGIGQALLEHTVFDMESGQLLSGSFMDYTIPRADDLPDLNIELNQDAPTRKNPLGAKGAGEAGCTGAPPAIVNAAMDALKAYGITHIDMPLTAEKLWQAIRQARDTGKPAA